MQGSKMQAMQAKIQGSGEKYRNTGIQGSGDNFITFSLLIFSSALSLGLFIMV
jgi:hypothetical protein